MIHRRAVYHKSYMDWSGIEPGAHRLNARNMHVSN